MSSPVFPSDPLAERLLDQRMLALAGTLDTHQATWAAGALRVLDGQSDEPVLLRLSSLDADLDPALAVVDALDLTRAPVHATCLGTVSAAAVALVAVSDRRTAGPHATLHLREPQPRGDGEPGHDVHAWVEHHRRGLRTLRTRLARACGRPLHVVAADMRAQRLLSAGEARDYGLVDAVAGGDRGS